MKNKAPLQEDNKNEQMIKRERNTPTERVMMVSIKNKNKFLSIVLTVSVLKNRKKEKEEEEEKNIFFYKSVNIFTSC